jgi:hypothetical protein
MAQMLSRNEVSTLIFNLLDSVYEVEGKATTTFEKFMKVESMDRGQEINYRIGGFGKHSERDEYEPIQYDQYEFGESQTVNPKNFGTGLRVSEEVVQDLQDAGTSDPYNRAKLAAFSEVTRRFRRSANWTVEVECANIYINGTATTAPYVQRDNLALFSASHVSLKNPPITQSNLQTAASLSAVQIQSAITSLATHVDDTGAPLPISDAYKVMVSPYNMFRLQDILKTKGQVDSNNNNTNPLDNFSISPVINQHLGASNKGFYVIDPSVATTRWLWRLKPNFSKEGDFDAVALKYRSTFRGVATTKDWHGQVGNAGA